MAGEGDGGNERRRDGFTADAPQAPATQAAPIPGKTTLVEQQLTGGGARPPPQKVGQQSLIEKESSKPAPPGPEAFGALAALVGAPRPTAGDAPAAPKHKHPAHPHAHDHKAATDAINSDDGQNVTRADLLAVEPQEIHFGRVPYRAGAEPTEAAPYVVTITNPTGDPINVEDIRPDLAAEFPIFSADSTETAIPPGGTLRFRVGFRPHRAGVQSTTIHVMARGTSMARVFATGHAEPEGGHWEALHLSTQRIEFPETAIGQESAPKPIRITNRSGVPVRIEDIAPVKGKGDQFAVYEAGGNEIAAGDSIEMSLAFRPTRRGSLDATFQVRTAGATEAKDLAGGTIHARGFAAEAVEANADAVREGRDVGPVDTYDEMLAALQAAQQFTEAGAGNDGNSRENYDRAEKLVAPVAARLDQLAQKLPEFANTMGFASTGTRLDFGYAHDDVRIWARLLRPSGGDGTPTINPQPYMLAFEQAKEIIQVLTGEQKDAPTLRTLGSAAKWTPLEIAGAAVAGGAVAWGGTEVAAVIGEGAAASPSVASITTTMMSEWQNARYAFSIAFGWIATHPDEANELGIWLGSIGINIVDAGGVTEFFDQIQDFESFLNIFGQMAEPVVSHEHAMNARRAAEQESMGMEPTTFSTGPRARTPDDESEAESNGGARRSLGSDNATAPPTATARVLARVRALIDHITGIADRARATSKNVGEPESEPSNDNETSAQKAGPTQVILQGEDSAIPKYAANVKPLPDTLDVFVHGDVDDFIVQRDGEQIRIDHRRLATYIEKSGARYKAVRLISCKSGLHVRGVAQHLANKLGVRVIAPTDNVHIAEDGSMTIGRQQGQNNGKWVTFEPTQSQRRFTQPAEPAPERAIDRMRRARGNEEDSKRSEQPTEAARKTMSGDEETDAHASQARAQQAAIEARVTAELETINVAVAPSAHTSRGYFVTAADGQRMVALYRQLEGAEVIEYKAGLLVRRNGHEWYYEYRDATQATTTPSPTVVRDGGGMPAPNVGTVVLEGYSGVRHINGRPKPEWSATELAEVERIGKEDPLIEAGHVAISFDGGKTFYGLTPEPDEMQLEQVIAKLKKGDVFPGNVKVDNDHFELARKQAAKGWDTAPVRVIVTFDPDEQAAISKAVTDEHIATEGDKYTHGYSWPAKKPQDGQHYKGGTAPNGQDFDADCVGNCATYPAKVGVPIPEQSGRMQDYMRELTAWSKADAPISGHRATEGEQ
jgi:hypothetical protein